MPHGYRIHRDMVGRKSAADVPPEFREIMLSIEITTDGGVVITGTERDLRDLADWLERAAVNGHAAPAFMTDQALTTVDIWRLGERAG